MKPPSGSSTSEPSATRNIHTMTDEAGISLFVIIDEAKQGFNYGIGMTSMDLILISCTSMITFPP